jgi:hypothetical protein
VKEGFRFSALHGFVHDNQIISGDKFLMQAKSENRYNYLKRDFLYKNGNWRNEEIQPLILRRRLFTDKPLVLGHSDIPTKKRDAFVLKHLGVPALFSTNNYPLTLFSQSVPLGITNYCDDSPIHKLLGDESHFLKANNTSFIGDEFIPTVYINFSSGNNRGVREEVLALAKKIPQLYTFTVQSPIFTEQGRINYLEDLRTHGLVLCPEGNGIDTHRFWETIYMGGVPVVTTNDAMQTFYNDLPVLQLQSWSQLSDRPLVEELWSRIKQRRHNFDLLSTKHWIERFSTQ